MIRNAAFGIGAGAAAIPGAVTKPTQSNAMVSAAPPPTQLNVTFNVDGRDLLSAEQVRRKVLPVLNDLTRRTQ